VSAAFAHGFLLALGLILPLGPQNAFLLAQGAAHARIVRAFPAVVAAGLSDTLLILLAVFGVSAVVLAFPAVQTFLLVFGTGFLVIVGWLTWRSTPTTADSSAAWSARKQVTFTLSVSLLNPHAILDTVGVIGASSLAYEGSSRLAFTLGCILTSWFFFFALVIAGRAAGRSVWARKALSRAAALVMWASAALLTVRLFQTVPGGST